MRTKQHEEGIQMVPVGRRGLRRTARLDARTLSADDRMTAVFELRLAGKSFDEIARELDYANRSSAWRAFQAKVRQVRATRLKRVEDLIELENARLDALLEGHLPRARQGETESAFVVLGAVKERAKINGLYAPTQARVGAPDGGPLAGPDPYEVILDRLSRLAAEAQQQATENQEAFIEETESR